MKSIAIVGASADPSKFGNKAVRGFQRLGWRVYPVNPRADAIEGLPVYRSVKDLPERPTLMSVYLPPAVTAGILPELAAVGCDEFWLNPGADTDELADAAEKLGLNVVRACSLVAHGVSPEAL